MVKPPGKAPGMVWNGRSFVPAHKSPVGPLSQKDWNLAYGPGGAFTTKPNGPGGTFTPPPRTKPYYGPMPPAGTGKAVLDDITRSMIPAPSPTGPYQGAAGSESAHPGQQRTPPPDWADPNSPNYERRNYYVGPNGQTVAREPGYYNKDNPFDTGRPGETQGEFRGMWDPSMERRMDEPGITPWGPGGKASKPGTFPGPGGATAPGVQTARAIPKNIMDALLGGPKPHLSAMGDLPQAQSQQLSPGLLALIQALMGKIPGREPADRSGMPQ